jgi:predicted nucleic acid-binding protein
LITHNYVIVETAALAQRRIGVAAARTLVEDIVPDLEVVWVDAALHASAVSAFLASSRRDVSIVDCASFELMRRLGIETALTFDRDFRRQGFKTVP